MSIKMNPKKCVIIVLAFFIGTGPNAEADFTFGQPVNLGPPINSSSGDAIDCFSADGLEMYIESWRAGGQGSNDLWVLKRGSKDEDWGPPENLGSGVNGPYNEYLASISADGLTLYFCSDRPYGNGTCDVFVTTRATKNDPWGPAERMDQAINDPGDDFGVWISPDNLELHVDSFRSGGYGLCDIYVARRANANDPWSAAVNLGPVVNTKEGEALSSLSADGLVLLFSQGTLTTGTRSGSYGLSDLWMARRASLSDPWQAPVNLGPVVNGPANDCQPRVSPDGQALYFESRRSGPWDVWQAPIIPIVDFNGDRKVDLADMHIMVDHWGENYPLCDIGPMPWGDGIVDVKDLIVLAEHLFEDYRMIAHWALDETEGTIAEDSAGYNDGTLNGEPLWQPTGGKVDGALLFDGADDYVSTPFILDPAKGSLSVFAWIYGGAPGQVIISQTGRTGGTWLGINPSEGNFMTGLSDIYFGTLESESVITDGQWHHVGLVYDMDTLHRRLYVDGVLVVEDTTVVAGLPSDGNLYIGSGKDLEPGSLFRGLIDDVRIYNAALTAEEIVALAQ